MKTPLATLLAALLLFAGFPPPKAEAGVSFSFFHDSLDPYGEWVEAGDYGYCWRPASVDHNWAPYTDGYWAYTDAGWTWVSYEDYGWITYHYGRWADIENEGWVWVPDYEWAPAWVSWRTNDDYCGWAPLPPRAHFTAHVGFGSWVDAEFGIGPRYYNFCRVADFGSPALRPVIVDRSENITIVNKTVNVTNIVVRGDNNVVYTGGPQYAHLAGKTRRPIQTLRLQRQRDIGYAQGLKTGQHMGARQQGNQLVIPGPDVDKPSGNLKPAKVAKVLKQPKLNEGWGKVSGKEREQLQAKMKADAKGGPDSAPAKQIDPEAIKIAEQKADETAANSPGEQVLGGQEGRRRANREKGVNAKTEGETGQVEPVDAQEENPAKGKAKGQGQGLGKNKGNGAVDETADVVKKDAASRTQKGNANKEKNAAKVDGDMPPVVNENVEGGNRRGTGGGGGGGKLKPFNESNAAADDNAAKEAGQNARRLEQQQEKARMQRQAEKAQQQEAAENARARQLERAEKQTRGVGGGGGGGGENAAWKQQQQQQEIQQRQINRQQQQRQLQQQQQQQRQVQPQVQRVQPQVQPQVAAPQKQPEGEGQGQGKGKNKKKKNPNEPED